MTIVIRSFNSKLEEKREMNENSENTQNSDTKLTKILDLLTAQIELLKIILSKRSDSIPPSVDERLDDNSAQLSPSPPPPQPIKPQPLPVEPLPVEPQPVAAESFTPANHHNSDSEEYPFASLEDLKKALKEKFQPKPVAEQSVPLNQSSIPTYENFCHKIEVIFRETREKRKIDFNLLQELYQLIISRPSGESREIEARTFFLKRDRNSVSNPSCPAKHAVDTSILATLIAKELGYDEQKIQPLRLAALLHDIGTTLISRGVLEKPGQLSAEELTLVRKAPANAFALLNQLPETKQYPWNEIMTFIRESKEREDGSGYPGGLSGKNISEQAKIIGLSEIFATLTEGRGYRKGLLPYQAVTKVMQMKGKFPLRLFKTLFKITGIYPVGTIVVLSSGEWAMVVKTTAIEGRPVVEILLDSKNHPLTEKVTKDLTSEESSVITIDGVVTETADIEKILIKDSGKI